MILSELYEAEFDLEEGKMVFARAGNKIVRKFRCSAGRLKGKTVSSPTACFGPVDVKKRFTLARTKAKMGSRMTRKAQRTKRVNQASRRLKALNR
jgi:hypothetical protein